MDVDAQLAEMLKRLKAEDDLLQAGRRMAALERERREPSSVAVDWAFRPRRHTPPVHDPIALGHVLRRTRDYDRE